MKINYLDHYFPLVTMNPRATVSIVGARGACESSLTCKYLLPFYDDFISRIPVFDNMND